MKFPTKSLFFGFLAVGALLANAGTAQAQYGCPTPSIATSQHDSLNEFHGRDRFALAAAFRDRGVHVLSLEGWSGNIKAEVLDENCTVYTEYFDPDTLQPSTPWHQ
jgi:S-adenosylmethionine hydrolase